MTETKAQQECPYCDIEETGTSQRSLLREHFDPSDSIYAMGAGLSLDYNGVPTLDIWANAPDMGYQSGCDIRYCPMCGRKLVPND